MKVYFVVLHYQVEELTKDCVSSLIKLNSFDNEINIVVVDNGSTNNSGERLKAFYKDRKNVKILHSSINEGFARGNNLGFKYAKDNKADFIVLLNNDVTIDDSDFVQKIIKVYDQEGFGVLGPDIYVPNENIHQNPVLGFDCNVGTINFYITRAKLLYFFNSIGLYPIIKKPKRNCNCSMEKQEIEPPYILHGSCLIFSKKYIDRFDGLYEKTFMYYEENILAYLCDLNGIKMYYSPELQLLHHRKGATKGAVGKQKDRNSFFYKNSINSLEVLKELIVEKGK